MNPDPENKPGYEEGLNMTSRELFNVSFGSLVVYLFLATLLFYFFHDGGLVEVFLHGISIPLQLLAGVATGTAAAGVIIFFSSRSPMKEVMEHFTIFRIISRTEFTAFDRIQISLFAGAGEELLFRGALQPLIGIWFTSFIFIAIHGYISFRSAGHTLFTLLLFGLSMLLGYLYITAGLVAAMTAHAVYDMLLLWWVDAKKEKGR